MNKIILFLISLSALSCTVNASDASSYGPQVKMPDTHVVPIKDEQNNRQYELLVKLPADYEEHKDVNYPVIYYTDAVWHIEMLSGNTYFMLEDVILVGVSWQKDNNPELVKDVGEYVSRFRDYSIVPARTEENQTKYQMGNAAKHLSFIRNDVFKYVEANYRTDPNNRTYFGYSLGGLFGAYILMTQPDTFKNYMLGSPSVWPRFLTELRSVYKKSAKTLDRRIFVSYGSEEAELSPQIDEFLTVLKGEDKQSLSLTHKVIPGTHQTASPGTVVEGIHWLSAFVPKIEDEEEAE